MKTVKAKLISSTPIRLSTAASILSKFATAQNGASQAVAAYLRRTSDAFNELSQLHKELKSSSSRSHRKNRGGYETEAAATVGGEENSALAPERGQKPSQAELKPEKLTQEPSLVVEEIERKRHKKKGEEKVEYENSFNEEVKLGASSEEATSVRSGVVRKAESGKKNHDKRSKKGEDAGDPEENGFQNGKAETGFKYENNEVEGKERKKRKSAEVEDVADIGSEEQRIKKKKKKRKSRDGDV